MLYKSSYACDKMRNLTASNSPGREAMKSGIHQTLIAAAAAALFINQASAQTAAVSDDVVKIGV